MSVYLRLTIIMLLFFKEPEQVELKRTVVHDSRFIYPLSAFSVEISLQYLLSHSSFLISDHVVLCSVPNKSKVTH